MRNSHHYWAAGRIFSASLTVVFALTLGGCNSYQPPVYEGKQGLRFTPPSGWVERARDGVPVKAGQKQPDLPLPKLGVPGSSVQERLLVRYDRLTAGNLAWVRVSVADLPASTALKECVSVRTPGSNWKRESEAESLEVSGTPASRIAFVGRWNDQDYINETVAVRQGEQVFIFTASFPASDSIAREEVRKAVAGATWK